MTRHHVEVRLATAPVNPAAGDGLPDLADETWMEFAECARIGPADHVFFPDKGDSYLTAKRICIGLCQVRAECADYAFRHESQQQMIHGIFGGLTAAERRQLRRDRGAA